MTTYYNIDERYGDAGPFEAKNKQELIDGMTPTFHEWAEQSYTSTKQSAEEVGEPIPEHEKFIRNSISEMQTEFALALVTKREYQKLKHAEMQN